jgi:hypothetical protein
MDFDIPWVGRQFKVGGALICVDPQNGERARLSVNPYPLADARIPHPSI